MKVLIGTKLLSLKDCVGYTKIIIHKHSYYFLIYERFDKISLVIVYMYGDISDFNFYNIKYLDINDYVRQKNMNTTENEKLCVFCQRLFTFPFICNHWSHNYFRFDRYM